MVHYDPMTRFVNEPHPQLNDFLSLSLSTFIKIERLKLLMAIKGPSQNAMPQLHQSFQIVRGLSVFPRLVSQPSLAQHDMSVRPLHEYGFHPAIKASVAVGAMFSVMVSPPAGSRRSWLVCVLDILSLKGSGIIRVDQMCQQCSGSEGDIVRKCKEACECT